jgi:hypothetical protein
MKHVRTCLTAVAVLCTLGGPALAECRLSDAKLEEAIQKRPQLRTTIDRQNIRDLRTLRDAAFTLWSYGLHVECERLLGNIRELIAAPSMGALGDNDEEAADAQITAREPKPRSGAIIGRRGQRGAAALTAFFEMAPPMRADEVMGAEVRTSDDKIIGEVRNIVFGTKDTPNYAIVATGGFFKPGQDSIVMPLSSLMVSQERGSFFVNLPEDRLKKVPKMPDQSYEWLLDQGWRLRNDALFETNTPNR